MSRLAFIALFVLLAPSARAEDAADWKTMNVPGAWEDESGGELEAYDGFAWYRCRFELPQNWNAEKVELHIEKIDNAHEVYLNGTKIGGLGAFPPEFKDAKDEAAAYAVTKDAARFGDYNLLAIRIYDRDALGGFRGRAPALIAGTNAILLAGRWEFRTGDNKTWAEAPKRIEPGRGAFSKVVSAKDALEVTANTAANAEALTPAESLKRLHVPDDLAIDLSVAEPDVKQPIFLNFDERGRMWVMQYLQYPYPEGLTMVSRDKFWRAVYDKVPAPPPNHVRGHDRITIHEDTDGDGHFETMKVFLDGLNIASAFERGRGGVWVLNPPYLLFYPDRNHDDIPDGDPEVHLQGFGFEDTHSVVNSLRWGPDGWLYGAQGSTVSGNVFRPGLDKVGVHSMGQLIWRYHPETRRYEIFAEGGGNAFGVELDNQARIYSGTNGGDARGYHYVQGGYYQKSFTKHGALSNPYAFGHFPSMTHHKVARFTHNFVIYEATCLPEKYRGHLFGVEPLQGQVVESLIDPETSTFKTEDVTRVITSDDKRFRPVEIKVGPDGGIYVADMYEPLISHRQHFEGQIDKTNGRIYRLRGRNVKPLPAFDLGKLPTSELLPYLEHENKWFRQTALRVIGDRRDKSAIAPLKQLLAEHNDQLALEAFWALYLSGGLSEAAAKETLGHANEYVRLWTVRVLCDDRQVTAAIAQQLAELAGSDQSVHVRSQLACSSRRLPAAQALPIIRRLLEHDEDQGDLHLPLLLWWAVETQAGNDPAAVVKLLEDRSLWERPLVRDKLLTFLMRRFAQSGSRTDLVHCAELLTLAPSPAHSGLLMAGFEEAFRGRTLSGLPAELVQALAKAGGGSLSLRVRQNDEAAVNEMLAAVSDAKTPADKRLEYVQTFGEVRRNEAVPVLLAALAQSRDAALQSAALTALQSYTQPEIAVAVLAQYGSLPDAVREVAQTLLASRAVWSRQFLEAVDAGSIPPESVPMDVVQKLTIHPDEPIGVLVKKHWKNIEGASTAEMQALMAKFTGVLNDGYGEPMAGKQLFSKTCAKCHLLFGEGGRIGPDLTSFKRDDAVRMLLNVVNPSAEIREGFETVIVVTEDGRTVIGFLFDQDNRVVVIRGADGQNITVPRETIEEMVPTKKSLMPEGLLKDLSEQEVRDLFAYLRSAQPLN